MPPAKKQSPSASRKQQNVRGAQKVDGEETVSRKAPPRRSTRISARSRSNDQAPSAVPPMLGLSPPTGNPTPPRGKKQAAYPTPSAPLDRKKPLKLDSSEDKIPTELAEWISNYFDEGHPDTDWYPHSSKSTVHSTAPRRPASGNSRHSATDAAHANVASGGAGPSQGQHRSSQGFGISAPYPVGLSNASNYPSTSFAPQGTSESAGIEPLSTDAPSAVYLGEMPPEYLETARYYGLEYEPDPEFVGLLQDLYRQDGHFGP